MKHTSTSRSTRDGRRPQNAVAPNNRGRNSSTHRAELPGLAGFALALALGGLSACGGGNASEPEPAAAGDGTPAVASASESVPAVVGDDSTVADAAASTSAQWVCDLISTTRLQAAFGHTYANGEPTHHDMPEGLPAINQCVWTNTDDGVAIFSLSVTSGEEAVEIYELTKGMASEAVPLEVGDDAYRVTSSMSVLDGDVVYDLNAVGAQQQATFDATAAIAAELVGG